MVQLRLFLLSLFIFLGGYQISVAQQTRFFTKVDARKIVEGSYVEIEFVLENATGSGFKAPKFDGFELISGPSTGKSTTIVNGRRSQTLTFGYMLAGNKSGRYTIGPATIVVNNKLLKTQSIIIEVVKGNRQTIDPSKSSIVNIELSDTTAYIGQQVLLDYVLYTTENVVNYNIDRQPEFDGFYVEEIRMLRTESTREIINGVEYRKQILKRYALFPQQTGNYTIERSNVTLGISTGRRNSGFFFSQQSRPKRTMTNSARILVDNIPKSAPKDFSGAVGSYQMNSRLEKRSVTTNEAITVRMNISGDGDSRMVLAPTWELPDGLEMYDPNVLNEQSNQRSKILHNKKIEYLLVAEEAGRYSLQPSFSYFDIAKNEFVNLKSGPFIVNVVQGEQKNESLEVLEDELRLAPIAQETNFSKTEGGFYGSWIHRSLLGLLLMGIIGVVIHKKRLEKIGQLDPKFLISQKAFEKAKTRIGSSQQYIETNKGKEYYEEVSITLKTYLEERFHIPALHLKKEELLSSLQEITHNNDLVQKTQSVLDKAEQVLYAPVSVSDMENTNKAILELLQGLESLAEDS